MKQYVWVLGLCCLLASAKASDKPSGVEAIEKKFNVAFMRVEKAPDATGKTNEYWAFAREEESTHVKLMGFIVPVHATDKQVKDCISSAEYAFGWYEGAMIRVINKLRQEQEKP